MSLQQDEQTIIGWLSGFMRREYPKKPMRRFFHAKGLGLAKATLTIRPDLPKEWQIGIFQAGKQYPCWARFSSTNPHVKPDWKKNFRGLALKVLGEDFTQDFLSANLPIFQAKDVPMLKSVLHAMVGNLWHKLVFFFSYPLRAIKALLTSFPCYNLLETRYWAQAAFKLGDTFQVRYSFVPHRQVTEKMPNKPADDFLTRRLNDDLSKGAAFFDLMVQFRTDPATMSVDDNTKEWDSPWHKLGTVEILQQTIDLPARWELGENITFSPWHCLPAHEPLGDLHRIRREIYGKLQDYRHQFNEVKNYTPPTPKSWEEAA